MNHYWTAFGSLFFLLHQDRLLWLLNAPVIGRWFRYVLRISGESSSVGSLKIDRILPNAIFWWHGPFQKAEFRTHAKSSNTITEVDITTGSKTVVITLSGDTWVPS